MSYLKQHTRLVVLMMGLIGAAVLFGSVVGTNRADRADAAAVFTNNVTCGDAYFDLSAIGAVNNPNDATIGNAPPAGALRVGKTLTRQDVVAGVVENSTQKLYLGADTAGFEPTQTDGIASPDEQINDFSLGELIPDEPPDNLTCEQKGVGAKADPEGNDLEIKHSSTSLFRPDDGTVVSKPKASIIATDSCVFSDAQGWIRQRTFTNTTDVDGGPNVTQRGVAALFLGTASPASAADADGDTVNDYATDPTQCTGGTPFPARTVIVDRDPTSDCPPLPAGVVADPSGDGGDGCGGVELADSDDGLKDDWDGDGCTDWDELSPALDAGLDPFNPEDCDENPTGVYNIFVDGGAGSKITCPNPAPECDGRAAGFLTNTSTSSFHCVAEINKSAPTGTVHPLTGNALCYTESAALAGLTGSAVPSRADGNAGAPPPPPWTSDQVAPGVNPGILADNSRYDSATDIARTESCFLETGSGLLSPNVLAIAEWDTTTGVGLVDIYANISNANCLAGNEAGGALLLPNLDIQFTQQPANADKDGDGCTDADELSILVQTEVGATDIYTNPAGKCGDDPYNPHDGPAKTNLSGSYDLQVTAVQSNYAAGVVPGAYFHCKADINESPDNVLTVRPTCYIDNPAIDINPTAAGLQAGDGLQGAPPPGPLAPTCAGSCYAPLDNTPAVLNGSIAGNTLSLSGCFPEGAPPGPLGNVYVTATVESKTGAGEVDIYTAQTLANCNAGTPAGAPTFDDVLVEIVRQAERAGPPPPKAGLPNTWGWDSDRDGCSDQEENGTAANAGGLRDPYSRWDFLDVPTGTFPNFTRNRAVAATDINAILGRFGASDTGPFLGIDRASDPVDTPVPASSPIADAYHPAYDRGGAVAGGLAWQRINPDGAVTATDFNAALAQFGHACTAAPNNEF